MNVKYLVLVALSLSSISTFAVTQLQDIPKATEIAKAMSAKCKDYRKKFDLDETIRRLTKDAESYRGLIFKWTKGSSASMEYNGIRMVILPSECQAPGESPVDSLRQPSH